jgi:DNA repair exonuclease SbcCD ATPase subunit
MDKNQGLWNRNPANENSGSSQKSKSKMKQLTKQLSFVKNQIEEFEVKYEEANGYRPTQQNNKEVRNMIQQLKSLKRQIRTLRDSVDSGVNLDDSPSMSPTRPWSPSRTDFSNILNVYSDNSGSNENSLDSHDTLESRFNRVEKRLKEIEFELKKERQVSGRPESLEDMNPDQVLQEKNSIQLALNEAQTILNTLMNASEEERSVLKEFLKDLLTRYRSVKRLVRRSSNVFIKDPCELETIPEGAEIQLTLASPQHRINIEMNSSPSRILDQTDLMPARSSSNNSLPKDVTDETDNNANEPNLHAMSRFELLDVQKVAKEDKKQLRKCLKEHEVKFLEVNGRPMPKDELKEHELYSKYKMTKAKLKLVDALLSKSVKQ